MRGGRLRAGLVVKRAVDGAGGAVAPAGRAVAQVAAIGDATLGDVAVVAGRGRVVRRPGGDAEVGEGDGALRSERRDGREAYGPRPRSGRRVPGRRTGRCRGRPARGIRRRRV